MMGVGNPRIDGGTMDSGVVIDRALDRCLDGRWCRGASIFEGEEYDSDIVDYSYQRSAYHRWEGKQRERGRETPQSSSEKRAVFKWIGVFLLLDG